MKLTAKLKLLPTDKQRELLVETLETANQAANYASDVAWREEVFGRVPLHRLVYYEIRRRFGLTAQMAVRVVGKVVDAYKPDRKCKRHFRKYGAIPYDNRILSLNTTQRTNNIWTLGGRQKMEYRCSNRHRQLLEGKRGEADLCYIRGKFYLFVACEAETPEPENVRDFFGVDFGIVNIASDSDGEVFSGDQVEENRRKHEHRRRNLQRKGTRAAKRKLRQLSGKQARFQTDVNHVISKRIVQKAQRTGRGIAIEDLNGIRDRVRVRRRQKVRHANWSFYDLRWKIEYKSRLAGVPVVTVDPRNTSRTCSSCGHIDKRNRPGQSTFSCVSCGSSAPADIVAARNIAFRARAAVNQPNELSAQGSASR